MRTRKGTGASLEVIGRLKEIPDVRATNNGKLVVNIMLAVDEVQKNTDSQLENYTEWLSVAVWGNAAQFIRDYAHPGKRLRLSANIKTERKEVEGRDGKKLVFYIPKFHTSEVEAMDRVQKSKSSNMAEIGVNHER